jgi:hypothetical protein
MVILLFLFPLDTRIEFFLTNSEIYVSLERVILNGLHVGAWHVDVPLFETPATANNSFWGV